MSLTLFEFSKAVVDLFIEYRDVHGLPESEAKERAAYDSCENGYALMVTDDNPYLLSGEELARAEAKAKSA